MKILVTGTPGVGKTTFSEMVAKELGIEHIDVTARVKKERLYDEYDARLDTYVFDVDRVRDDLNAAAGGAASFVIDTHSPAVAADIRFDFIFHLRCDTATLYERLKGRGYSEVKISENLDCECLDMVGAELEDCFDSEPLCVCGPGAHADDGAMSASEALAVLKDHAGEALDSKGQVV